MAIETLGQTEGPEQKFEDLISRSVLTQPQEWGEKLPEVDFLFESLPVCIHSGSNSQEIGFMNGGFISNGNRIEILGRIVTPSSGWETRGVSSKVGLVEIEKNDLESGIDEDFHDLAPQELIKSPDSSTSIEDVRITELSKGNFGVCGVLYGGLKDIDGKKQHDVTLGLGTWQPESTEQINLKPILPGYKNGVLLGPPSDSRESYLLCRDMEDTREIKVAKQEGESTKWEVMGNLSGFWEAFPEELKDKIVRVGPGTNPIYIEELGGFLAGFHWVMKGPEIEKEGEEAEYYVGGLMLLDSISPPKVTKIYPYAISPMDAETGCLDKNLFKGAGNKHVVFPMGAARLNLSGQDQLVISAGFNDVEEHFYSVPVGDLVEKFNNL